MQRRISELISRASVRVAAPLLGAGLLTALMLSSVPFSASPLARPRTPFDRSAAAGVAPGFALLTAARSVLPEGAVVVTRTEPRDAIQESHYHWFAVALLPGRSLLPSAMYGVFTPPEVSAPARYVVVVGPRPAAPPGTLLLETPDGSVWRRSVP